MHAPPLPVAILVAFGLAVDAAAVLMDPRGNLPLAWGLGGLCLAAAFLWPRQPDERQAAGSTHDHPEPLR
jgi:hypothetical protein